MQNVYTLNKFYDFFSSGLTPITPPICLSAWKGLWLGLWPEVSGLGLELGLPSSLSKSSLKSTL